ncbi:MAG: WD40 repeat domain-containing protein [Candidatus Sumerlaeia bacterium]|nr:WD40 repeat domain-containing protein [Candidatus Sumerlaeia bacterium]
MRKSRFISIWTCIAAAPVVLAGSLLAVSSYTDWWSAVHDREIAWHGEQIKSTPIANVISISPDGTFALIQEGDDLKAFDTVTGEELWSTPASELPYRNLLLSNGGERILTFHSSTTLHGWGNKVYNGRDLTIRFEGEDIFPGEEGIWFPAGINDAGTLAVYRTLGVQTLEEPRTDVRVINLETGEVVFDATRDEADEDAYWYRLNHAHFNQTNDEVLLTDRYLGSIFHLDLQEGTLTHLPREGFTGGHVDYVVSPDFSLYAYQEPAVGVKIIEFPSHEVRHLLPMEEMEVVHNIAFNGDGSELLIVSQDEYDFLSTYRWIDTTTSETLVTESRHRSEIVGTFVHNGTPGFLEAGPGSLEFLDAFGNTMHQPLPYVRAFHLRVLPFDNDNSMMVLNSRGYFSVFDIATEEFGPWKPLPASPAYYSMRAARTGQIAIIQVGRDVLSLDLYSGEVLRTLRPLDHKENAMLAISHDGSVAAVGIRGDNTVSIFDPNTGNTIGTIEADHPIYSLTMTPDGSTLAFSHEESVATYDHGSGELISTIDLDFLESTAIPGFPAGDYPFPLPFVTMTLSPDGRQLAMTSLGQRGIPWLFDMEEGTERALIGDREGHSSNSPESFLRLGDLNTHLEFSPDGHRLLISPRAIDYTISYHSSGNYGTRLIDIRNRHHIREYYSGPEGSTPIEQDARPKDTKHHVAGATFSLDGTRVLGVKPRSRTLVFHNSGIPEDDLNLVNLNILSAEAPLPATAPGVDISEDGVLDSADLIYIRRNQ